MYTVIMLGITCIMMKLGLLLFSLYYVRGIVFGNNRDYMISTRKTGSYCRNSLMFGIFVSCSIEKKLILGISYKENIN